MNAVAWSDSGTYIAALNTNQRLFVWDVQRDSSVADMPTRVNIQLSHHKISFVPEAEHLIWTCSEIGAQLINWRQRVVVHTIPDCRAFALSASGAYVAYWREEESVPVVVPLRALAEEEQRQD